MTEELNELRQLIKDFKEAISAAQIVDKLTGQPDCVDPEKSRLLERVETLEKELKQIKGMVRVKKQPKNRVFKDK